MHPRDDWVTWQERSRKFKLESSIKPLGTMQTIRRKQARPEQDQPEGHHSNLDKMCQLYGQRDWGLLRCCVGSPEGSWWRKPLPLKTTKSEARRGKSLSSRMPSKTMPGLSVLCCLRKPPSLPEPHHPDAAIESQLPRVHTVRT